VAQEDDVQLMMRSFDPSEQAAREERLATQRFLQMQVLYLQKKLSEREDEVRELHKENDELQRHITRLEMQQFRAEMAAQYGSRDATLKRKAPGADDENTQQEEGVESL
jgi:septal ring factor EnvC (AmiA/AmiB activator)